jgi:hypothetical protein
MKEISSFTNLSNPIWNKLNAQEAEVQRSLDDLDRAISAYRLEF